MQIHLLAVSPTPFLRGSEGALMQRIDLTMDNPGPAATVDVRFKQEGTIESLPIGPLPTGESTQSIYLPEMTETGEMTFRLVTGLAEGKPLTITRRPARHWQVHLVQNSHHDLGYTGLPTHILRQHDRYLSDALEYAHATDDYPSEARFRIVIEQVWSLEHFLETSSPSQTQEMLARLRSGRFEVNALYANMTTELCSHEELIHALYPSARLSRLYGVPITSAEHNDITGFTWGLSEALLGAGVRLFIPGIPMYYNWGNSSLESFWDQKQILPYGAGAFNWLSPAGGKLLVWCGGSGCGGDSRPSLPGLVQALAGFENRGFPFQVLRWPVTGANSDNSPYRQDYAEAVRDWNAQWTYPRLTLSTNAMFYQALVKENLTGLPVFRGDLPGQDYPVGAASTATATGINRRTHSAFPNAEAVASAARIWRGVEYPKAMLDEAFQEMLLHDEHTWGFQFPAGPAGDAARVDKAAHAYRAAAMAHDIAAKAMAAFTPLVGREQPSVIVFNALGQTRSGVVRVPMRSLDNISRVLTPIVGNDTFSSTLQSTSLPGRNQVVLPPEILAGHFDLLDLCSGRKILFQIEEIRDPHTPLPYAAQRLGVGNGSKRLGLFEAPVGAKLDLVFAAQDVPACGYKTYQIGARKTAPRFKRLVNQTARTIENEFYRITLTKDGRCSLVDQATGKDLIDPNAPHPLGSLVVREPDGQERVSRLRSIHRGPYGPVSASLDLLSEAYGHPRIRQTITLFQGLKHIDLAVNVLKDATPLLDAHLAFPFAADHPTWRYEGGLCSLSPVVDAFPGAQSDRLAVQNWVNVSDSESSLLWASLDAPVVSLSQLWDGYVSPAHRGWLSDRVRQHHRLEPQDFSHGWIYSQLFANNFGTNFANNQPGCSLFRFRISTFPGKVSAELSAAWGKAAMTDFETSLAPTLPDPLRASLVQVQGAQLLAFKQAEDGRGWILRLWNPAPDERQCQLFFPELMFTHVCHTDLVENDLDLPCRVTEPYQVVLPGGGLVTLRFTPLRTGY